jgi:hypothetical protein
MKFRCKCGKKVIDFAHMTQKDFPDGYFMYHCCEAVYTPVPVQSSSSQKSNPEIDKPQTSFERWLSESGFIPRDRNLYWVKAFTVYLHYLTWMTKNAVNEKVLSGTLFGRAMSFSIRKTRKCGGQYYLLQKQL